MQAPASSSAVLCIDKSVVVTKLTSAAEAKSLPHGAIVGDLHGGLTFNDAVAAALEARSIGGWHEMHGSEGEVWTLIVVNR